MMRLLRAMKIFRGKKSDDTTLENKVEFLRKAGLNVVAIDKNKKYKNGYVLGEMKDSRLVSQILSY